MKKFTNNHVELCTRRPNSKEGPDPELDEIYSDAQKAGEFGADCSTAFPKCNMETSFFDMFAIFGQ